MQARTLALQSALPADSKLILIGIGYRWVLFTNNRFTIAINSEGSTGFDT